MEKKKRIAILRLVLAAIVFVVVIVGTVVLLTTGSPVLIAIGIALLVVNSLIWLPTDIRSIREPFQSPVDQQPGQDADQAAL